MMKNVSESSKLLDEMLLCPICLSPFRDPRSLRCLHTFCTECLVEIHKVEQVYIPCPVCRNELTYAPSVAHIRSLPVDYHVDQMKDYVTAANNKYLDEITCDVCTSIKGSSSASQHCLQCRIQLCDACHLLHHQQPAFADHVVISLASAGSPADSTVTSPFCAIHRKQTVRYFCWDCTTNLCTLCTVVHDQSHLCEPLTEEVVKGYCSGHKVQSDPLIGQSPLTTTSSVSTGNRARYYDVNGQLTSQPESNGRKRTASVLSDTSSDATSAKQPHLAP